MRILRAANYKVMPWKNGLGSTTEIAIAPASNGLGDFDWRVSMAQVTMDGPFSSFPHIDRTLLVLKGAGIILSVADHAPARIDARSIYAFPGDQSTSATLIDGPITDLNVMTRRGRLQHRVQRIKAMTSQQIQVSCMTLLFVERGTLVIKSDTGIAALGEQDALLADSQSPLVTIDSTSRADVIIVEFW